MPRDLSSLRERLFFTIEDVVALLRIDRRSAQVLCSRYVKNGQFIRLKRDFYVLEQNWANYSREDFLRIANFLQVPSYISLMTALSVYGVTTQVQQDYFESVSLRQSVSYSVKGKIFDFHKVKKLYYFGFQKRNGVFIASKEKALVDAVYLWSFGRYPLDWASLDLDAINKEEVLRMSELFPKRTKNVLKKICKT